MIPLVLAVSCALLAALHPDSVSRSELRVGAGRVDLLLRCQIESVNEVVPADADGNGLVETHELEAVAQDLSRYLLAHYVLRADGPAGPPLPGRVHTLSLVTQDEDALFFAQFVDAHVVFQAPPRLEALHVEMTLYFDTSPLHRDSCRVVWPDGTRQETLLREGRSAWTFPAPMSLAPLGLLGGLRAGLLRALGGGFQLGLLLGLLAAAGGLRAALRAGGAFVAVHLAVLGLLGAFSTFGGTRVFFGGDAPASPLAWDVAAALLLVVAGSATVLRRGPRPLAADAWLGGLVLGARDVFTAAPPPPGSPALAGYAAGLVLAWLGLLAAAGLLLRRLPRRVPQDESLAPAWVRDVLALTCAVGGAYAAARALFG